MWTVLTGFGQARKAEFVASLTKLFGAIDYGLVRAMLTAVDFDFERARKLQNYCMTRLDYIAHI